MAQRSRVQEWKEEDLWLSNLSSFVRLLIRIEIDINNKQCSEELLYFIAYCLHSYAFLHIHIYTANSIVFVR